MTNLYAEHEERLVKPSRSTALAALRGRTLSSRSSSRSSTPLAPSTPSAISGPAARKGHDEDQDQLVDDLVEDLEQVHLRPHVPTSVNPPKVLEKEVVALAWQCRGCQGRECFPIRSESRCLCGHRLKDHHPGDVGGKGAKEKPFACRQAKCACSHFNYIVAEGSWILRCRCKHKHTDHDPRKGDHPCLKDRCGYVDEAIPATYTPLASLISFISRTSLTSRTFDL
jgi:hypothetical protein